MGIVDDDVARVREATDLVALAGEHLALKRSGRRFVGLCPFHPEKTPSFSINAENGFYYCFGCAASGDAITFVREVEHLDFVGAVERLAARAGIQLRYDDAAYSLDRKRRDRLHAAVAAAIDFYHDRLMTHDDAGLARRYLRSRSYEKEAVQRFKLGYSPDGFDALSRHLEEQKFSRADITDAGLAFVNKTNRLQDAFRGRLMFPIYDARGDAAGFGGRSLDGVPPKYKNTQETPIYQKSRLLYGLNWAKPEIVARGEVVICEGYTDVMAFVLAGVPQVVATCGTALADEHFTMLKNFARKVTLAYDADAAGRAAAERCYQWEQKFEVQFQVADLPPGRDPGDLWPSDAPALVAAVERAAPFLEFRVDRLLEAGDLSSIEGRARAAGAAAEIVAEHPNELVRDQYVMKLAGRLQINDDRLRETVERSRRGDRPRVATSSQPVVTRPVDRRELDALRWAVHAPSLVGGRLAVDVFIDPLARDAYRSLSEWSLREAVSHSEPEVSKLLERLAVEDPIVDTQPPEDMVSRVVVNLVEASSQRLLASMLTSGDERSSDLKSLLDLLVQRRVNDEWSAAEEVAEQLVGWIVAAEPNGDDGTV
ncbi:MAG: primase [Actinomycetota bacterium]|nr:primase [Actinomycetota bacterium]